MDFWQFSTVNADPSANQALPEKSDFTRKVGIPPEKCSRLNILHRLKCQGIGNVPAVFGVAHKFGINVQRRLGHNERPSHTMLNGTLKPVSANAVLESRYSTRLTRPTACNERMRED